MNTGNGSNLQFQSMLTPQAMGATAAQGVGGSMDRLANYYLDMAAVPADQAECLPGGLGPHQPCPGR